MSCDVGGVGAQENIEAGGADGVLGENELQQLATQVILISSSHVIRDGWVSGNQAKPGNFLNMSNAELRVLPFFCIYSDKKGCFVCFRGKV